MTNTLTETGPLERPDKFHSLQAETDVKLAIDSGYEPDTFGNLGNIPLTADLQRYINEQKLTIATKESEEASSIKLREEREEKREQSHQAAIDELSDSEKREQYLNESHAFGDIEYTGKQWQRISEYAKANRSRITEDLLEKGYTHADIEQGLKVTEIMANPNATKEEKQYVAEAAKNDNVSAIIKDVGEEAGYEAKQSEAPKPASALPPTMQMAHDF